MRMKKIYLAFGFLGIFAANQALAATPQVLGEYGDWIAYYYQDRGGIVCYMASTPKKDEGKYTKRGDIYTVITHRPSEKSYDVVNFVAGYTFKPGSIRINRLRSENRQRLYFQKIIPTRCGSE